MAWLWGERRELWRSDHHAHHGGPLETKRSVARFNTVGTYNSRQTQGEPVVWIQRNSEMARRASKVARPQNPMLNTSENAVQCAGRHIGPFYNSFYTKQTKTKPNSAASARQIHSSGRCVTREQIWDRNREKTPSTTSRDAFRKQRGRTAETKRAGTTSAQFFHWRQAKKRFLNNIGVGRGLGTLEKVVGECGGHGSRTQQHDRARLLLVDVLFVEGGMFHGKTERRRVSRTS